MVEVSTSILSANKEDIAKTLYNLEAAKTDYFHIDVMDGIFVKRNTDDTMKEYCSLLNGISNVPLDVHLMVKDVKEYVNDYAIFNPNIITFHLEALDFDENAIRDTIKLIKDNNAKVGISIKPNTKIEEVYKYLNDVHMVLIMTVEPGEGGQKLIPKTLEKVKILKRYIDDNKLQVDIEVDGGINKETCVSAQDAGADILVSGSYIVKSNDMKEAIKYLKY